MEERNSEIISKVIKVRPLDLKTPQEVEVVLDEVMMVEERAWPLGVRATKTKFESRAHIFPQGFFLANLENGRLVGVSTAEIINFDPDQPMQSWEEITDNGMIKKTHDPNSTFNIICWNRSRNSP